MHTKEDVNNSVNGGFISLHPKNNRYFIYKGKPTVLITTTEHYGAVTNAEFEYEEYLDMLKSHGFNLSRIVVLLRETVTEFKGFLGYQNTLCPKPGSYISPWKRSEIPGCYDGGNKFDLDKWNQDFFVRLKDFCKKAEERGIIIELTFFSQYYSNKEDSPWVLSPLNPINNITGEGASAYNRFTSLENKQLVARQEALVRKIVAELKNLNNIYYEICNEPPYPAEGEEKELAGDHASVLGEMAISEWQNYIASVIIDAESSFTNKHMIAVCDPHQNICFKKFSVLNYHYREWVEKGIEQHYSYGKPLAFDETLTGIVSWNREMDFAGRRKEAWEFLMKGCSIYNYLDFTIATDDPVGEGKAEFPGGYYYNGLVMRNYLKYLKVFFDSIDFINMKPNNSVIKRCSNTVKAYALVEKGKTYAIYINGSALKYITLELEKGNYRADWYSPVTGKVVKVAEYIVETEDVVLELPLYYEDIVLRLTNM